MVCINTTIWMIPLKLHKTVHMQSLMLKQKLRKMTASGRFAGGVIIQETGETRDRIIIDRTML